MWGTAASPRTCCHVLCNRCCCSAARPPLSPHCPEKKHGTETAHYPTPTVKEPLASGGVVCEVELSMESCFKENPNQCPGGLLLRPRAGDAIIVELSCLRALEGLLK